MLSETVVHKTHRPSEVPPTMLYGERQLYDLSGESKVKSRRCSWALTPDSLAMFGIPTKGRVDFPLPNILFQKQSSKT